MSGTYRIAISNQAMDEVAFELENFWESTVAHMMALKLSHIGVRSDLAEKIVNEWYGNRALRERLLRQGGTIEWLEWIIYGIVASGEVAMNRKTEKVAMREDEFEAIGKRRTELARRSVGELKEIYSRYNKICYLKGLSRLELVGDILRDEFGNRRVDEFWDRMDNPRAFAASVVREGDVCKVSMALARNMMGQGVPSQHQIKILNDVVRQGGGYVDVDEIRGVNAMVSAHDNPGSKLMGGVSVPVAALVPIRKEAGPAGWEASRRESRIARNLVAGRNYNKLMSVGQHGVTVLVGRSLGGSSVEINVLKDGADVAYSVSSRTGLSVEAVVPVSKAMLSEMVVAMPDGIHIKHFLSFEWIDGGVWYRETLMDSMRGQKWIEKQIQDVL